MHTSDRLASLLGLGGWLLVGGFLAAHDLGHPDPPPPGSVALKFEEATRGPVKRPPTATAGARLTGQGYWRFEAITNGVLPLPAETLSALHGAHGTLLVDAASDTVFWGLENVGWVAFSHRLTRSWVVKGDPAFSKGNLHGADLLPRRGKPPLVAVADNVEGEAYLSDTTFGRAEKLDWPTSGPYQNKGEFHPTDAAFAGPDTVFVADGYGQAWFMPAGVDPLAYRGEFHGGKAVSQTPHGITYDRTDRSLWISARPEAQIQHWSVAKERWLDVRGLPAGSTVCDVDLWGHYALAPCLDGPGGAPGPVYIIDLKRRAVVSTLRPQADLGFTGAQHIHDAAWYVVGKGQQREVYVLFTNWNPGGIGAMRLVDSPRSVPGRGASRRRLPQGQ